MQPSRKETVVVSGIRLDANSYRVLGEISQRTGKSIAGLIREAVARMLADDPAQGF
jgi:predicted DNA-binding protein